MCALLGVNYQSNQSEGANQDEKQQMAQRSTMDLDRSGGIVRSQTGGESIRVSNTRRNTRLSYQYSDSNNKRVVNSGNTSGQPAAKPATEQQQPKPEPSKPVTPTEPAKPEEPEAPTQPEPEPTKPGPVYLLSIDTPVAKVEALPTEKEEALINIELGKENNDGDKTEADTQQQNENKAPNRNESKVYNHSHNGEQKQRSKCPSACKSSIQRKQQDRKLALHLRRQGNISICPHE